jgi:excisionase family DNA binding protein
MGPVNLEARMNVSNSIDGGGTAVAESRTLLTKRVVARRLGVCSRTVERLVAAGTFPKALMVGSARRWEPSDVDRFIERLNADRATVEVVQ